MSKNCDACTKEFVIWLEVAEKQNGVVPSDDEQHAAWGAGQALCDHQLLGGTNPQEALAL